MLNEWTQCLLYIIIGFVGGGWHYVKKRYVDNTTTLSFIAYLQSDKGSTIKTIGAIILAEFSISSLNTSHVFHIVDFVTALTAGYTADSHLNKCSSEPNN